MNYHLLGGGMSGGAALTLGGGGRNGGGGMFGGSGPGGKKEGIFAAGASASDCSAITYKKVKIITHCWRGFFETNKTKPTMFYNLK